MTISAITFEIGDFPSVELQLASSEGLAPLMLPQPLSQPSPDAVSRFQAAMEDDSRRDVEVRETQSVEVAVERPIVAEKHIVTEQPIVAERPYLAQSTLRSQSTSESETSRTLREISSGVVQLPPVTETTAPQTNLRAFASPREENVSHRDTEAQRGVAADAEVKTGFEVKTGLTGFTRLREVGENVPKDVAGSNPQNPVNPVNPVEETIAASPVKETTAPQTEYNLRAFASPREENVSHRVAETQSVFDEDEIVVTNPQIPVNVVNTTIEPTNTGPVAEIATSQTAHTEAIVEAVGKTVEIVNQVVEAVVAEIAVTPTLAQGEGEIRIVLKPTVLDGSEVHLSAKGGELTVSIAPATAEAAQAVQQNLPRLETALAAHASSFHHIAVEVSSAKKGKIDETA